MNEEKKPTFKVVFIVGPVKEFYVEASDEDEAVDIAKQNFLEEELWDYTVTVEEAPSIEDEPDFTGATEGDR